MKRVAALAVLVFVLGVVSGVAGSGVDHGTFLGLPVVILSMNDSIVQVPVGDTPAVLLGGRAMVPLRRVSELFGATVVWDAGTQTATITWDGGSGQATAQTPGILATALIGEAITTQGITAKVESITYAPETNWPTVIVTLRNDSADYIRLPSPYTLGLVFTLSDPAYEAAFAKAPCVRGFEGFTGVYMIAPGATGRIRLEYALFWPAVTIESVTLSAVLVDAAGASTPVAVGVWTAPVGGLTSAISPLPPPAEQPKGDGDVTGVIGDTLTVEGISVTMSSLTYGTAGPVLEMTVRNGTDRPLVPFANVPDFIFSLSNPQYEQEFNSLGFGISPNVDWVYPGESRQFTMAWRKSWPGVTVLAVTYTAELRNADGSTTPVVIGTWTVP
jgi:hypothetical protein